MKKGIFLFLYCWGGESPGGPVEGDIANGLWNKYSDEWGPFLPPDIRFVSNTGRTEGDRENFMIAFALKGGASKDQLEKTMAWHVDTPSGQASYFIVPATKDGALPPALGI